MIVSKRQKILMARFYRSADGGEPVRAWLKAFDKDDRRKIGTVIQKLEFGWPIGMPHCRAMGHGIWEIRVTLNDSRALRLLFFIKKAEMILLHGFIKKTSQTPTRDLDTGLKRMKELLK
jgi:phage-related protein